MRLPWEELEPASHETLERQRRAVHQLAHLAGTAFAVAMALIVLQLVDRTISSGLTATHLFESIRTLWPTTVACLVSLLILLTCWLLHHIQFHYLTRSSGALLLLHTVLLLVVLLVPLSTAVLHEVGITRDVLVLYTGHVFLLLLLLLLMWRHAVKGGLLFGSDVPARIVFRLRLILRAGIIVLPLILGLAFASAAASLGALVALFAIYLILITKGGYTLDVLRSRAHLTEV